MAVITNYTTLQTAISDYLARSDLTTFLPNFVQTWEENFYRDPGNWGAWMETAYTGTIASSVIAVPSDFLAWKSVYVTGSPGIRLDAVSLTHLYERYPRGTSSGTPRLIARNASNFEFGPAPDSNYSIAGTYYGKQTVLRTDSDGANWLTTNAPDLLLYGALLEAEPFLKNDARVQLWQSYYERSLASYRKFIKATDLSSGPLAMRVE